MDIFEQVKKILCDQLDLEEEQVNEDSEVIDDLGADSLEDVYKRQQELDADIMASTYGLPEMARMLGVHRQTIYYIVANEDFELDVYKRQAFAYVDESVATEEPAVEEKVPETEPEEPMLPLTPDGNLTLVRCV